MRIMFIALKLDFETGGGSAHELDTKIRALMECGYDPTVVTLSSKKNKLPSNLPYTVIEEYITRLSLFHIQKKAFQILKKYESEADVFHVEVHFGYGAGLYRLLGGKVPVFVHANRELSSFPESTRKTAWKAHVSFKRQMRFFLEKAIGFRLMNFNDQFSFTSPKLQGVYIAYGLQRKRTVVIPDFFDSEALFEGVDKAEVVRNRSVKKDKLTVLCGGRMIPEKGFDVVVRALAETKPPERFKVIMTGTGPELEHIKKLAHDLNIENNIEFVGWVANEQMVALFRTADMFVIPRWRPELTSMQALEAMGYMIPYIVTKNTAIAWQAEDGALMFEDEDYEALAVQMDRLAVDAELRVRLVKNGLRRLKELDVRAIVGKLDEVMRGLRAPIKQ